MTAMDHSLGETQRVVRKALHAHWVMFLVQGMTMVILGVVAFAAPAMATIAVDIVVGWLFLISGIFGVAALFSGRDVPTFLWTLITAALSVVVGAVLIWKPVEGAFFLTLLLTTFFIAEGIFQTVASFTYRDVIPGSWGWMLASGLTDLALAAIIIATWPLSAGWVLGLFVGVNLMTSGLALIMTAIAARDFVSDAGSGR